MKLLTSLLLPLCAATAMAQSPAILSKENTDFMRGLMNARYYDLAEALAKTVAESNLPDAEKNNIAILKNGIDQVNAAAGAGGSAALKDAILAGIKQREATIAKDAGSATSDSLRAEVTDQYGLLANAFKDAIAEAKDPQKQAELRKEGDALFDTAIKTMEEQKAATEQKRNADKDEEKKETTVPFVIAFYNLGRLRYYRSLLWSPESIEGKHSIDKALETLDEFDLEFGELLVAFEAKLIVSLCHKQLGKIEDALAAADEAIGLRERVEKDSKGVYKVDDDAAGVISKAVVQKQTLLAGIETDDQRWDKIIAAGKDYLATIPNPLRAEAGLNVLCNIADAHVMKGENAEAKAAAEKVIEEDPKGRWGYRGQQILVSLATGGGPGGKAGPTDLAQLISAANTMAAGGEGENALAMCRLIAQRASGPDDAKYAAEAMMVAGVVYAQRKCFEEAAMAYDAVHQRFPKTTFAPEAVWRALSCYVELNGENALPYWKKRIEERSKVLRDNFPDNPHVPELQLVEAKQLEKAQKFDKAAEAYEKIPAESTASLEARFGAANCYRQQARKLENSKLTKDAKEQTEKAKAAYRKLVDDVAAAQKATADAKVRARLDAMDFRVRVALANFYLQEKPPMAAEVEALLKDLKLKDDDANTAVIWALRIGALAALDKVDEAQSMFDSAVQALDKQKGVDQKPLASIAGALASKLDERAAAADKGGLSTQAKDLWRRAVTYYLRSAERASTAEDQAAIADRLFVIGLKVNGIDKGVEGFFELPDLKATDTATWEQAADLYERLLQNGASNYRIKLARGRALGYLKRWSEAASVLDECITELKLVDRQEKLDQRVWTKMPELVGSYLELGYALRNGGVAANDKGMLARAGSVFDRVFVGVAPDTKHWWFARYGMLRTMIDRGDFTSADVMMRGMERSSPDFDNDRFKLKNKFVQLKLEIKAPK